MVKVFSVTFLVIGITLSAGRGFHFQNSSESSPAMLADQPSDRDILETVFRYQIDHCYKTHSSKIYFLSYKEQDPPDDVLTRLSGYGDHVRKRSQMRGFRDTETGESGILLAISKIERDGNTTIRAFGSCGTAMLDANSYVYKLRRKNGLWRVTQNRLIGVS